MTLNARRLGWRNSRWNQFSPIAPQDYCRRELEYQTSDVRPARQRNESWRGRGERRGTRTGTGRSGKKGWGYYGPTPVQASSIRPSRWHGNACPAGTPRPAPVRLYLDPAEQFPPCALSRPATSIALYNRRLPIPIPRSPGRASSHTPPSALPDQSPLLHSGLNTPPMAVGPFTLHCPVRHLSLSLHPAVWAYQSDKPIPSPPLSFSSSESNRFPIQYRH